MDAPLPSPSAAAEAGQQLIGVSHREAQDAGPTTSYLLSCRIHL